MNKFLAAWLIAMVVLVSLTIYDYFMGSTNELISVGFGMMAALIVIVGVKK